MPVARRSAVVPAAQDDLWLVVSDPHHLPRWWPRVIRVEGVHGDGFTQVLRSDKGASVRADFRFTQRLAPELTGWEQELEGTPFERILAASGTSVRLAPAGPGETKVILEVRQELRGMARLGGFMVRRATRRQLTDALRALAEIAPGGPSPG